MSNAFQWQKLKTNCTFRYNFWSVGFEMLLLSSGKMTEERIQWFSMASIVCTLHFTTRQPVTCIRDAHNEPKAKKKNDFQKIMLEPETRNENTQERDANRILKIRRAFLKIRLLILGIYCCDVHLKWNASDNKSARKRGRQKWICTEEMCGSVQREHREHFLCAYAHKSERA